MSVICARISGVLRSSCILGGEINHEAYEGHGEFRGGVSLCWRLRSGERGLPARSARQLAEHKIPSASCRRFQEKQKQTPHEKLRLFAITQRIIVDDAVLVTGFCISLRELRAGGHPSC